MIRKLSELLPMKFPIIGMIHVGALPGTPCYRGDIGGIVDRAHREAVQYQQCGIDAVMVENMHDVPYVSGADLGPEVVASMTRVAAAVKDALQQRRTPCGVQILASANREALAVAKACDLDFIRAEGFVFAHVADEGMTDACAGPLLRYRKQIDAEHVLILTDIKKKHSSHAITEDVSLVATAQAAEFFLSDGVIVTGASTGASADLTEVVSLGGKINVPVIIGSGVTHDNLASYWNIADGAIVGTHFKTNVHWTGTLSEQRTAAFMQRVAELRTK